MLRRFSAIALMLTLLLQAIAPAGAMARAPAEHVAAHAAAAEPAAMPCHGMAAHTADTDVKHPHTRMPCCDDDASCSHCAAACGGSPTLPATATLLDDYVDAHFALVLRSDAVLLAHPLVLLRPPIEFHG